MLVAIGIVAGIIVSLIGSFILSLYPYLPFYPIFLATVVPSVLAFVIVSYRTKINSTRFKCWLNGFFSLFVISLFAFAIKNYIESQAIVISSGSSMNWDAVIIFNILYSLGAAILLSPISYFMIRKIKEFKSKQY